jgi:hypothetical protein
VDPRAGKVEYVEVPSGVYRVPDEGTGRWHDEYVWRTPQQAKAVNSRGAEVTGDDRSRWDGWDWVFNGSPTFLGEPGREGGTGLLYFTLASGLVYVLDPSKKIWDHTALLSISDLGPAGETWSANSLSYGQRRLYHRTARELICVGPGSLHERASR